MVHAQRPPAGPGRPAKPASVSASGLVLAMAFVLTLLEAALIVQLIQGQRAQAYIIEASGLQRMRTQRIAYLVTSTYGGLADPGWNAELRGTLDDMERTRREVKKLGLPDGPGAPDGTSFVAHFLPPYIAAARAFARDPHDRAAFEYVREHRSIGLHVYDAAVAYRTAAAQRHNDRLLAAISLLVPLFLAILAGVWVFVARPMERRVRKLLGQLTRQRAQLSSFIEEHPDLIGLYDGTGTLVRANRAHRAREGSLPGIAVGSRFTDFVLPEFAAAYEGAFDAAKEGRGSNLEMRSHMNGERDVDLEVAVYPNFDDEHFAGVISIARDVTEARRAAQTLEESREQMFAIFDQSPQIGTIHSLDGTILRANRACRRLFGSEAFLTGRKFWDGTVDHSESIARRAFLDAAAGGSVECDIRCEDGAGVWYRLSVALFPYVVHGRREGVVALANDVSELRRMEAAEARHSRRMQTLYDLAAQNVTLRRQLHGTIEFARTELGYESGFYVDISDGMLTIESVAGKHTEGSIIKKHPVGGSLTGATLEHGDVFEVIDIKNSVWRNRAAGKGVPWQSYVGVPISVGESCSRTFALASSSRRRTPLTESDRQFVRLVSSLVGATIERIAQAEKLDSLAFFDSLTGLPNRVHLRDRLDELLVAARKHDAEFAVHFIDLDRFKAVNDNFGHAAGDEILRTTAARLLTCADERDVVTRIAGDEFVVLQPLDDRTRTPDALASLIVEAIDKPFLFHDSSHTLGASVGFALFPRDGNSAADLLEAADRALYRAKRAGRGRWSAVG